MHTPLSTLAVFLSALAVASALPGGPAVPGIFPPESKSASELTVKTPSGVVIGHYAKNGNYTGVREFLGIPYAKPPTGTLRWAPPQKTSWTTPFEAKKFGNGCIQTVGVPGLIRQKDPEVQDEDCLKINIWTPSKKRNPLGDAVVMIWTHGGGFEWGEAATNIYNGANLVNNNRDVILVSYNYRLNVFGFPAAPGLGEGELNPGLRDMRRAVEWTRDNIKAFGGNPKRMILFGESAGGAAVDSYLYAYPKDPIIRGAISQSGVLTVSTNRYGPRGENWAVLSRALGCPDPGSPENLPCLRGKPALEIRDAAFKHNVTFSPAADNGTIFSDTTARLERGQFARIPVLIGSNDEEIPGKTPAAILATRTGFTCPAAKTSKGRSKYVPTWQYRWFGDYPTTVPPQSTGPYHGTEITSIFQTYNPAIATPEQIAASKYVQGAWVAFAKNPTFGLSLYGPHGRGWPRFKDNNSSSLVQLSYQNKPGATFANPNLYQAGC